MTHTYMVCGLFLYITYVYLQLNRLRLCTVQPPTVLTTMTTSTQQMCQNNSDSYQCRCSTQRWWKGLSSSRLMEADHGVFYKEVGKHIIIFAVHVDQGMVTRSSISLINKFKEDMNAKYKLTDLHLEKPKPYILHYCTQYNKFTLMDQKNTLWCTIL